MSASGGGGGALGCGHNLTVDREFRYIIQWFSEWSDFQRDDFVPVLASYLANTKAAGATGATAQPTYVNGIIGGMAGLGCPGQDKPMSLFQCRVKLFNEWSTKWPESHRETLLQRLAEIDADFGRQVQRELSGESAIPEHQISSANDSDPEEFGDPGAVPSHHQHRHPQPVVSPPTQEAQTSPEPSTIATAAIALVIGED